MGLGDSGSSYCRFSIFPVLKQNCLLKVGTLLEYRNLL